MQLFDIEKTPHELLSEKITDHGLADHGGIA
jgi:hypothetical protein